MDSKEKWYEAVNCLAKAILGWLLDLLQVIRFFGHPARH